MSTTPTTPQRRYALGLPAGTIRSLLALGVLGYLWVLVLTKNKDGDSLLLNPEASQAFIYLQFLMVLIIAHFFTAHGHSIGAHLNTGSPLGLPRGSVRLILLAGYLGLAYFLWSTQPPFTLPATGPVLLLLAVLLTAFFVGHVLTGLMRFIGGGVLPFWFQDIQVWFALIGLLLLGVVVIVRLVINRSLPTEAQLDLNYTEAILAGVVGFYFGARS